jgi:flagellar biosynthetic protein FliR
MDYVRWLVFLLVFTRITAFIAAAPFFSNRSIPPLAKMGMGFGTAILISPFVSIPDWLTVEVDILFFGLMLAAETLLGLSLAVVANMVFTGIRIAGQLLDLQIGFGMSGLVDPTSQMHSTLLGNFFNMVAVLLLVTIDGHHSLLLALAQSYELVPPGGIHFQGVIVQQVVTIFGGLFNMIKSPQV